MSSGVSITLVFYFVVLSIITFISTSNKSSDFLRASKEVTWWGMGISLFASMFSSYNLVVGLSFAFLFGPWVLLVYFGALLSFYTIFLLIKNQRESGVDDQSFNSIIDFVQSKFGYKNASLLNITLIVVLFVFIALQFFVNTSVFTELVGWNKYVSTIVVGFVVLAYTALAGLKVEVKTDIFQGILMLLFFVIVFFVDTSNVFSEDTIKPFISDINIIIGAVSFAIAQFLTILVQPETWQRFYAVKDTDHLKIGLVFSSILILFFVTPIIITGLSAFSQGVNDSQNLFFEILKTSIPENLTPYIFVALFAAFMSSIDSSLFAISSQIGKYGIWIKNSNAKKSEKKEVKHTRIYIFIVTILAMVVSLFFSNFLTFVVALVSIATVLAGVIAYTLVRKISNQVTFYGFIIGIISFIIMAYSGVITDDPKTVLYPTITTIILLFIYECINYFKKTKS